MENTKKIFRNKYSVKRITEKVLEDVYEKSGFMFMWSLGDYEIYHFDKEDNAWLFVTRTTDLVEYAVNKF